MDDIMSTEIVPVQDVTGWLGLGPSGKQSAADLRMQITMAPIHVKLPPETLINTFRYLLPSCCKDIRFTHVCSLWRELIHRTPEFWVDMLSSRNVFYRLDRNAQSGMSVMSFIQRSSPLTYPLSLDSRLEFLETIRSHIHRISSLSFTVKHKYTPSPNLLSFPGSAFPSLRQLDIGDPHKHTVPLLNMLRACPQLQILQIHLYELVGGTDSSLLDIQAPVSLTCLRKCHIRDNACYVRSEITWVSALLGRLNLPTKTKLQVYCAYGGHIRPCSFLPCSPSVSTITALDRLQLSFTPMGKSRPGDWRLCVQGCRRGTKVLSIDIYVARWGSGPTHATSGPSNILSDFARIFAHAPSIAIAELDLEFGKGVSVVQSDWLLLLQALPTLTVLEVRIDSCKSLLTVLRKNSGLCPALRTLAITCGNGSGTHGELVSVVERRDQGGQGLQSLTFRGSEDTPLAAGRLARLKTLVPNVDAS